MAAVIHAEREGTGAAGAREALAKAEFDIADSAFGPFIDSYFAGTAK